MDGLRAKHIRNKILKLVGKYAKYRKEDWGRILSSGFVYDEKELINLVNASLDFWLVQGKYAEEFESKLAKFLGLPYCLLTNSGSSANLIALATLTSKLLGDMRLREGHEVITTACAFPTTVNPIIQNKLIPVFVDVGLGDYNVLVERIEKAMTTKTKAIMLSHNLGNPFDLHGVLNLVEKHHLWLIEDNCQALGSKYGEQLTGTFGHLSTCSFYPAHHITMGEGGAILTRHPLLRKIALSIRDWGRDCWCKPGVDDTCKQRHTQQFGYLPKGYDHKYTYSHIGYNLKITDTQASIGVAQLDKLPDFIKRRKENFDYLYEHMKKHEEYFILPKATQYSEPSWFGFPLLVNTEKFTRTQIVDYIERGYISTRMMFGGNLTRQPAYDGVRYRVFGSLENSNKILENLFWIGVYPGITKDNLKYMTEVIDAFIHSKQ